MKELHEEPLGGYFAFEITKRKLLDVGYWWPTMYRDVHDYCKSCDACQRNRRIGNLKSCKPGYKSSRGTIYEMGT
jgi:hypothetical protein